jgi:hypothetical protein
MMGGIMTARVLLEVIALHPADAEAAQAGGADRLELCASMDAGGLCPTASTVSAVRRVTDLPLRVMLRLSDSFATTGGELSRLAGLAESYLAAGADGFVFGFLTPDNEIDVPATVSLAKAFPDTPWTFHRAVDAVLQARDAWRVIRHLPEGVFQVVPGGAKTGELLVEHPNVAAVSFTGSIGVGRTVARQAVSRGAKVQCETGGQNPSVVLADADLDRAAKTIAYEAMGYAGQKRSAASPVIAEDMVYEELRDCLVAAVEELELVDPGKETCQVGPMIEKISAPRRWRPWQGVAAASSQVASRSTGTARRGRGAARRLLQPVEFAADRLW